jgi:hypothetical protein
MRRKLSLIYKTTCSQINWIFGVATAVPIAIRNSSFGQDIGKINISDLEGPPIWADALFFSLAAFGWYLFYRLLNRWNRRKAFSYWFPTLTLIAVVMMLLLIERINSPAWLHAVFIGAAFFVGWVNFPVLAVAGILGGVWIEALPVWIRIVYAGALFWLTWHMILRHMYRRALEREPLSLNLSPGPHGQDLTEHAREDSSQHQ